VGVLLEIARQMGIQKPNIGVDIIFFDAEDYGGHKISMEIPKIRGAWEHSIGQKISMFRVIGRASEFYSIWWVRLKQPFFGNKYRNIMHRMLWKKCGHKP
jgi:hypothetical protein